MFQVNENLSLIPYKRGIQLLSDTSAHPAAMNVEAILDFPFNIYFMDCESRLVTANDMVAINHNIGSITDVIGHDMGYLTSDKQGVRRIHANDKKIVASAAFAFLHEEFLLDERVSSYLSLKMPIYSEDDRLMGVLGLSRLLQSEVRDAVDFLNQITLAGLLNTSYRARLESPFISQKIYFTPRENEVISHLIKSKTARKISTILGLSQRTVEAHIENIKLKMGAASKPELVEALIDLKG